MKITSLVCPNCGAKLQVDSDEKNLTCQYCGNALYLDDEITHVEIDNSEQAGYDFEKGRQRAQNEQIQKANQSKSVLRSIDSKAEEKGSALVTLWQFVKFIFVSLLAMIVQFALLNLLKLIPQIRALYDQPFSWWVFVYSVAAGGLGYFIVSNTANICAQIVAFFVNREKTFNSSANIAVTLPIYIVFTIALIVFSAWLNPTLKDLFVEKLNWNDDLAANTATMICAAVQFFLYFPVDKILFHKKKEEAAEETTAE